MKPEKILIVYNTQKNVWMAVPGAAILSRGDNVSWRAIKANTLYFVPDPTVFSNIGQNGTTITATVSQNASSGYYVTPMKADGNDVGGDSAPGIIID